MQPVNIIINQPEAVAKSEKKELSPAEEALAILARYDEGTPPKKFGFED